MGSVVPAPSPSRVLDVLWLGAWAVVGIGTYLVMMSFELTPGQGADAPAQWPGESAIATSEGETLLMLLHPQCSCSHASIAELARVMAHAPPSTRAVALFVLLDDSDESWRESSLWDQATRIDNVSVFADEGGVEAARFGAATSGQVLAYDAQGVLRFAGGITPSRAHEGDSTGRAQLLELLSHWESGGPSNMHESEVFGCPLEDEAAQPAVASR